MKRLKKALLLPLRITAYRFDRLALYYWADRKLFDLRSVVVMPELYYRWLYRACMWLNGYRRFRRLADRVMHSIPYHVRFEVA